MIKSIAAGVLALAFFAPPAVPQYLIGNLPFNPSGCTTSGQSAQYNPSTKIWECVGKYGEMYFYTASSGAPTALAINSANQYHGMALTATGTTVSGWTYKVGASGTVSAVADNGGVVLGTILVTTAAPHGLAVGDYVCHTGFVTRTTYRGKYRVLTTPLTTTYTVTRAFEVATDTGFFQRAWSLRAGTGSAGLYRVSFAISAQGAGENTQFRFEVNRNATDLDNIAGQHLFHIIGQVAQIGSTGIVSVADDDVLYVSAKNITDANDFSVWLANLSLTRL